MEYTLMRTKRKTVALQIMPDGAVVVRAPLRLSKQQIDRMVAEKEAWILAHQQKVLQQKQAKEQFSLADGRFPLMGQLFPVEYMEQGKAHYADGVFYLCKGTEEQLREQAQQLYRTIAREELSRRVAFYAQKIGVIPTALRINGAKGRWGSCSGKNSLNFSWRLMLADEHSINYVVVHELCHILHHDHSAAFWKEVERFFPDWKECRKQLGKVSRSDYFPE